MPTPSEHPGESSPAADVERLLEEQIGDDVLLTTERKELPKLLHPDERLLDVAPMALKGGRYGLLAITDRRLLHIHFRDVFSGSRITEIDYHNVRRVRSDTWRSFGHVVVDLKQHQRLVHFPSRRAAFNPLPGLVERVEELATCLQNAVRRVQEPIKPTALPLKPIG